MSEGLIFFIIFAAIIGTVIFVGFIGESVKRFRQNNGQENSATPQQSSYKTQQTNQSQQSGMTAEQRRRLEYLREQQKQKQADKHEKHVEDAHEHGHTGEEEHYEEIVGSLGEVNDEGCIDLDGVRFIAHDLAYDTAEDGQHDYTQLAKAIVLGEIINSPRFKNPHSRK